MTVQTHRSTTRLLGRSWAPLLGAAVGAVALAMTSTHVGRRMPGSYAASSTGAHALVFTVGAALVVVGVAGWFARPHEPIGPVALGLGVTWIAQELMGWRWAPVPVIARVVAVWAVPLLAHVAFRFPDTMVRSATDRIVLGAAYVGAGFVSVASVLIFDPFYDVDCWRTCASSPFVVSNRPRAWDAIETGWLCVVVAVGLLAAGRVGIGAVRRWRWPPSRSTSVTLPLTLTLAMEAAYAASRLTMVEDPTARWFARMFQLRAFAFTALAAGTLAWLVHLMLQRRRLSLLSEELSQSAPGRLAPVLARSLGDDSVEISYWSPTLWRYLDAEGRTSPPVEGGRIAVSVERGGRHLGVVTQHRDLTGPDVAEQIGPAARLAFENERLRAEQLAQIAEVRRAREEIVRTADQTRQRIERDLHDGAQQRLLALTFQLRLAANGASAAGATTVARSLDAASLEARACVDELRALAHGIFPSVLTDAGLSAALDALRDDAAVPVRLDVAGEPLRPAAAMAAYLAVVESVDAAADAEVGQVRVHGRGTDGCFRFTVEWSDGDQPTEAFTHVADRVGAAGGELRVSGPTLEVMLPCASS